MIVHSGGMDSSLCLALAIEEFSKEKVLSLSFRYGQRHRPELEAAKKICKDWQLDHVELDLECMKEITANALMDSLAPIVHRRGRAPSTLVVGRNGLMAHLAGIHAQHLGAHCIYMGIMELDSANSGYRDCSHAYIDLHEKALRMDLDDPSFEIRTPLARMTKKETMDLACKLGILDYLLKETVTCYEGLKGSGCEKCPACKLRNEGIRQFMAEKHPCHGF